MRTRSQFTISKEVLQGAATHERKAERARKRKADWKDPTDKREYLKQRVQKKRSKIIERYTEDNRCPGCRSLILKSRQWVIIKDEDTGEVRVRCRSCATRERNYGMGAVTRTNKKKIVIDTKTLKHLKLRMLIPRPRYVIDGAALREAREFIGCPKREFARRCGWTFNYQHKIETSLEEKTLSQEQAKILMIALAELGVATGDLRFFADDQLDVSDPQ